MESVAAVSSSSNAVTDDLLFGAAGWVSFLDARRCFRRVPAEDPELEVFALGDLPSQDALALARGGDAASLPDRFVVLVHDPRAQTLTLVNDRYGLLPVFIARSGEALVLSTTIAAILARGLVPRSLDLAALADLLAFDAPFGRRTPISHVTSLPAGTRVDLDLVAKTLVERRHWDPASILAAPQRPFVQAEAELVDALFEGFDHWTRGERLVGITLSGGIDSRCLLAAALSRGIPVSALNGSAPGSRSARYAERMARLTGTRYHAYPVGFEFAQSYAARLRGVVSITEGMSFSSEVEAHWLRERDPTLSVVLHGAYGELSKLEDMHTWFVDAATRRGGRASLADTLWQRLEPRLERVLAVFSPELRRELPVRARQSLEERLRGIPSALSVEKALQVLYIEEFLMKIHRCGHLVWNDRVRTRVPFAWPRYVDRLLATRDEDRLQQNLQMSFLRRTSPTLFRFADSNTGLRMGAPEAARRLVEFVDRVRRVLSLGAASRDHSEQKYWIAHMQPTPEELLLDGSSRGVFDRSALERAIALLRQPRAAGHGPLARLRQRIAQHVAAPSVERALMLRFWSEQTGVALP